jgi:hypothetical protein
VKRIKERERESERRGEECLGLVASYEGEESKVSHDLTTEDAEASEGAPWSRGEGTLLPD